MTGRFLVMLGIGLLLMFGFWAKEWAVQNERTDREKPIRGCAQEMNCPRDKPICITAPEVPKGVCTMGCGLKNECPEFWCCRQPPGGDSKPPRCLPAELCPD